MAMKYPKVDPNVNSAVYIWEYLFYANVPGIAIDSETYLRERGNPMTGNKQIDDGLKNAYRQTYLPIYKLAEIVDAGYEISVRESETVHIYDYVKNHLNRSVARIGIELEPNEEAIGDLFKLDHLSGVVYPYATSFFGNFRSASQFIRTLKSFDMNSIGQLFRPFDPDLERRKKLTKHDLLLEPEKAKEVEAPPAIDIMRGHSSVSDELRSILDRGIEFIHRGQ